MCDVYLLYWFRIWFQSHFGWCNSSFILRLLAVVWIECGTLWMGCSLSFSTHLKIRTMLVWQSASWKIGVRPVSQLEDRSKTSLWNVIYTKCTRQFNNFYQPITNLTVYQKGVHNMGIRIFNSLPPYIKDLSNNVRKFEIYLKWFLHIHSFYSVEEYFQYKSITYW